MSSLSVDLRAIRGEVDASEAARLSIDSGSGTERGVARPLFYPYYWFLFRETVETFFGSSSIRISCLVDGRTGLGATSDPFDVELRRVGGGDVLACAIEEGEALEVGRRLVRLAPRARRRALVIARRELLDRCLVYKPYWVVSSRREEAPWSLVDGVTGARWYMNRM